VIRIRPASRFRRSTTPPQDLSGSGHPSDALGSNGNSYSRTDRSGWLYTKSSGVWALTTVGTGAPDIYGASNVWYYASPYVSFTGQRGDQQTNGNSWSPYSISALGTAPNNAAGADGTNNIQQVTDPVNGGSKKALLIRLQENDVDTGGANASRTMFRYLGDPFTSPAWTDSNSTRITVRLRTQYVVAFSVCIPSAMHTYCDSTKPSMQNVLWQVHDNSLGTLSPNIEFRLCGRTDTSFGKASGAVGIAMCVRGNPNNPPYTGSGSGTGGTQTNLGQLIEVAADTWLHFVMRFKLAYTAGDSPSTEVWAASGSGSYTKVVDSTAINCFKSDAAGYGDNFDHYISWGQYIFTPSLLNEGVSLDVYAKEMDLSVGGYSPTADDLDDIRQFLQVR
jgi:hypothetical protein